MTPFDFLNSINDKKRIEWSAAVEKDYAAFMCNRGLGYFPDTVLIANEMNTRSHLDKKMQYDFLMAVVPKGRRMTKWNKVEENPTVELLVEVYSYSRQYAGTLVDLLSEQDIDDLKQRVFKGGRV